MTDYPKKPYRKGGFYKKPQQPATPSYKERRGPLKPLMTEEEKCEAKVQELSYDFACRITRLFQYLTEDSDYKEYTMSKAIYHAATSLGAHVIGAQAAGSSEEFATGFSQARKEQDQCAYWLKLLNANGYINDKMYDSLDHDCQRLGKCLTSITKTLREKKER